MGNEGTTKYHFAISPASTASPCTASIAANRVISLLGAAPAVAAAKYTDEISSDTAESVGEDLSAAMGSAVEAYTSLPPIITVAPGAAITVMVDRDLEIW